MKTKLTNWEVMKNDFYKKVRECKDELKDVLDAANRMNYIDFDLWYQSENDYRFLKDILGERAKKGLPFDYLSLIHLPKINGVTIKGDLNLADYDFLGDNLIGDSTISIQQVSDPESEESQAHVYQISSTTEVGTDEIPTGAPEATWIKFADQYYALPGAQGTEVTRNYVDTQDAKVKSEVETLINEEAQRATSEEQRIEGLIPSMEDFATKTDLARKQDTLIAGENITIENNVISATGGSSYTAGNGLQLSNNEFSIDEQVTATKQYVQEYVQSLNGNDIEY